MGYTINCGVHTHTHTHTVQQSTYYGLAGMLPRRYPQAVMTGESVAGLVVSINRIITKAAFQSERFGAIAFFVISLLFILVCVGCHCFIRMSPFVRYHTARCQQEERQETAEQVMPVRGPLCHKLPSLPVHTPGW